ncbi:MAG: LysM peptidoglycan-binding domain-containing protein [Bacteroidales bacterium]|nr:LysM peptidoglycan-binding domain-containing protein [Bacteroidales bacterium]
MFQKSKLTILLILLLAPAIANAQLFKQKESKKQLKEQVENLTRKLDSLKSIIDGGAIAMSDTTTYEESNTTFEELALIDSLVFENATPGSNPDSLLSVWYKEKSIPMERYIIESDSVELFSNIPDSIYIAKIKKMNSFIPIPYNHIVRNQIIAYTEKMPTFSKKVLALSEYYLPIFEEIFDYYGLPKELKAMAIIESGLNPVAVSRARAKGMWQFMYRTALQYNLHINSYVDERLDPIKATHAAAKYLRDAYTIFGDWALAISSYNCGTGNVNKAIRRAGSKEFWDIYPYLPRETRGYVPAFVGALYMLSYYKEYPNLTPEAPVTMPAHVDTFAIKKNLHFEQISHNIGITVETLRLLNPQYIHDIIPGNEREYILQLPYNYTSTFIDKLDSIYTYKDSVYFNPIVYNSIKQAQAESQSSKIYHKVRSGETLGKIASKYRVSLKNLLRWNGLTEKSIIKPGQRLVIYRNGSGPSSSSSQSSQATTSKSGGYEYYTIKKGDTLSGIAYKCGVSLNTILRLNGLTSKSKIYPGRKLKVKKL